MRLHITTDYAIRVMLFMVQQAGNVSTGEEAAKELGITHNYFNKVVHKIRTAGFLESIQGPSGGYFIAKGAENTTLYDIIRVMEGDICINRCLDDDGFCSRNATLTCPVHKTFESIQNQMIDMFKSVRVCDLCNDTPSTLLSELTGSKS